MTGRKDVPFTAEANKALSLAADESARLGLRRIRSEHILLGVLRLTESWPAQMLVDCGVDLCRARKVVDSLWRGHMADKGVEEGLGASGRRALELAVENCVLYSHSSLPAVSPGHLLLGSLEVERGQAAGVLFLYRVDVEDFKNRLRESLTAL